MNQGHNTSRRWAEIEALFGQAVELAPDAREAFLDGMADDELRHDLRSLLVHHAPDGAVIADAIGRAADEWVASTDAGADAALVAGRRFGAYEATGALGQGGMGTVYRARRADGQFEHDVAIKLVRHGFETPDALERFRQERQILARLTHPAIARLLDGGTATDDAGAQTPYLVMEYVEGQSITAYCSEHAMSIADRVKLFQRVCEAVQYAHQQLIVHRDLKPTNILVTPGGQPKLLDFGIAKLLTDDSAARTTETRTGMQLLTPEYASPEQVTGDRVTAAADIYSLGLLLYELLTGQKAHRFRTRSPIEIGRVICDTAPMKPSVAAAESGALKLRRQLEGDLDTIVLKALQKEPARRYHSVEQLSADLARHLEGLPVLARPDAVSYRVAKFVQRNRWPLVATSVVVASLVAGTAVSVWQAQRAERRFAQVRTLANSLIYDVHDEIRNLPGSIKARQRIVTTGLEYLNGLAGEAAGDPGLQRDVAAAYIRIGDVQGGVLESNLGDVKGALESYRKARALFASDAAGDGARQMASVDVKIGNALSYSGDVSGALDAYARARSIMEPIAAAAGASVEDLEHLATVFEATARVQGIKRENAKALDSSQRVLSIRRRLLDKDPSNETRIAALAGTDAEISMGLQRLGKPKEALPYARESLALREQLAQKQPNNVAALRSLILSYSHVADVLGNPTMPSLGDAAGAIAIYRQMTDVGERLVAADASDRRAKWDLANCLLRLGSALLAAAVREEGIERVEGAAKLLREIAAAEPSNNRARLSLSFAYRRIGDALADARRTDDAIDHYRQAIEVGEAITVADPSEAVAMLNLSQAHIARGLAEAKAHRRDAAIADGRRAIEVSEKAHRLQAGNQRTLVSLASAYAAMGRIHQALDAKTEACGWWDKSHQTYEQARHATPLDDAQTKADLSALARDSATCR